MFDIHPIVPSFEATRVLLSQQVQVDQSHVSSGVYRWPFAISASVPSSSSSSRSSSGVEPSLGHQSTNGNSTRSNPRFQLVVTIYRQGRFAPKVRFVVSISCRESSLTVCFDSRVRQVISYVPPPDPSVRQSSPPSTTIPPYNPPANLPWTEQKFPSVVVRGVMFGRVHVEVECKVSHRAESCRLYDLGLLPFSSSYLYVIFCRRATPSLTCMVPSGFISGKWRHTTTPCPHK